jgi:uncharacterized protein (DUF433 family)
MTFIRIVINPAVFTGKHCIRRLRFPVARLAQAHGGGRSSAIVGL